MRARTEEYVGKSRRRETEVTHWRFRGKPLVTISKNNAKERTVWKVKKHSLRTLPEFVEFVCLRERERVQGRGREREFRAGSALSVQSLRPGLNPPTEIMS